MLDPQELIRHESHPIVQVAKKWSWTVGGSRYEFLEDFSKIFWIEYVIRLLDQAKPYLKELMEVMEDEES